MYDFKSGLATFYKIEPELANKLGEFVTKISNDWKTYKTTGKKTEFLQKYLPDVIP